MNGRVRILKRSQKQEKDFAERAGGRTNPGSGSSWHRPNDVRVGRDWLVELKRTDNKKSITIQLEALVGVERKGLAEGRIPVLGFQLGGRNYLVFTEEDALEAKDDRTAQVQGAGRQAVVDEGC